ncbi:hypothetical protein LAZ67_5004342 [Cordylochernes scorpioides]|uniref:SRCR domain-containing protein n=1 Tax=Cordylochernes scorpioides TaxID=51811 RepID=A0ABY6KJT0_9ARAC|nr:hypothetical protein LAZ67_5004342 [Cordylochernes scorpioides]
MEDASMGEQEKLLCLPNYLARQPLELFRKLRLADRSYFQVRQILLDLYPESSEASFAKYFAMKLTGQANLETYYREKTAMGLQLGLPQEVILETLTEGLPFSDQRLVRVVPPENQGEWFRLVQRIHGPSVPTTRHREDQPPTMSGPYHNPPRRPGAWHAPLPPSNYTIAGFVKYGNTKIYLHVVVDHFSRYAWTFPSKSTSITTYQQFDIFVLTETWCQNPLNFAVENYKIYHSPALKTLKRGRSSGGIIMGVSKRIQPLIEKVEVESQWISAIFKLVPTADSLLVCMIFVYLPPIQTQLENLKKLFSYIENKIQEGFEIVLYGDLNVRTDDLGDFYNFLDTPTLLSASRASSDPVSSSLSETLVDFFDDNSLTILNGRSTSDRNGNFTFISSQGSSVIDLAVVSSALPENIVDLSVECMPYSDHLPLVLKLKGLDNMKSKDSTKFCPGTKYSWVADKAISFKGNLRDLAILPLTGSTLDSQVERLTIEIQTAMSRAGLRREIRSGGLRSKPWLTGGSANISGSVEVFHAGRWGSVCDDEWDEREGLVVCRALGLGPLVSVAYSSFFGQARPL